MLYGSSSSPDSQSERALGRDSWPQMTSRRQHQSGLAPRFLRAKSAARLEAWRGSSQPSTVFHLQSPIAVSFANYILCCCKLSTCPHSHTFSHPQSSHLDSQNGSGSFLQVVQRPKVRETALPELGKKMLTQAQAWYEWPAEKGHCFPATPLQRVLHHVDSALNSRGRRRIVPRHWR